MKHPFRAVLIAALCTSFSAPVQANDFLGGVVGGIIGGAIVNEANKNRRARTVYRAPRVSSAVREERRQTQIALNHFGFPAGTPDGVLGRRSRAAISNYQAFMQMPATGQLTEFQKSVLLTGYQRAISGAPDVAGLIAKDPNGVRAVLVAQRAAMLGTPMPNTPAEPEREIYAGLPDVVSAAVDEIAERSIYSGAQLVQQPGFMQFKDLNGDGQTDYILDTGVSESAFWCGAANCTTIVFASSPVGLSRSDLLLRDPTPAKLSCTGTVCAVAQGAQTQLAAAPAPVVEPQSEAPANALPLFALPKAVPVSMAGHCASVDLSVGLNGGLTQVGGVTDPRSALSEQFCLARTEITQDGAALVAKLGNFTPAQIAQQCAAFAPVMAPILERFKVAPADAVLTDVAAFLPSTGMSPAQIETTARVCLSSGYSSDRPETAIGAALLLVATGDGAYAEMLGHHHVLGFGEGEEIALGLQWYDIALAQADAGKIARLAAFGSDRMQVLTRARLMLAGGELSGGGGAAVLPVFGSGTD